MAIPSNCALCKCVKPGNFQAGELRLGWDGTLAVKVLSVICMHVGA